MKAPAVIFASSQFQYSSTVANSATAQLQLLQGTSVLATSAASAMPAPTAGARVSLGAAGVLSSTGNQFVLQPGITYAIDLVVNQGGGCAGTSALEEPNISYLALPVPAA